MKIRKDFVTNSSSTGYCMYGIECYYYDDILNSQQFEKFREYYNKNNIINIYIEKPENIFKNIENTCGLTVLNLDYYKTDDNKDEYMLVIGSNIENLQDDMTLREFKKEIYESLLKIDINLDINNIKLYYGEYEY